MAEFRMQLLGELRVFRGEQELDLPPSKKTRALLAYLALNDKKFRREQLCELLWEVPDDPRGSLRWSLSKIRRLVDDEENQRVVADRSHVFLAAEHIRIDSQELLELVAGNLQSTSTEQLIAAAHRFDGQFLEGLELANFHEFSAWCVAEREQIRRTQSELLKEVVVRLRAEPEQSLEFARRLVFLNPYDKTNRIRLIELMSNCGRVDEAKQQYEQGCRLLKEVGEDTAELHRAWRGGVGKSHNREVTASSSSAGEVSPISELAAAIRPSATAGAFDTYEQNLIGRDAELIMMQTSFDEVLSQQQARCLLFKGEPGIGKSSLLQCAHELAKSAHASIFRAGAFESEIVRPFALWNDALRESSHSHAVELLSGSERIDRDRLFASISKLVMEEARKAPVVIIFDDIQWSDESSAAALHYVMRMNSALPVWVVLGAREEELKLNFPFLSALRGLRQSKMLTAELLQPLAETDVLQLIAEQVPEQDSKVISEKSRGNPLLALELARAVAAGDVIGTLNELIGERLARMDASTITSLHWAAVLAPNISIGTLIRYTELDDNTLENALEDAEKSGFLFATANGYKFSHGLVTRSIYRGISSSRRKNMHRRIAESLEEDAALDLKLAAELARHAAQGGDSLLAARSLVQASRLCLRFYANDDAFNQAERGLVFAKDLSETDRIRLTLELKEVQLMAAPVQDWETVSAEFVSLAENALDHGAVESARLGYQMASNVRWSHGQWSGARKTIMQAERVTRGGSEEVHILGMAEAARCLLLLEKDLPEADAMLMEASSRAERNRVESDALPAAKGMMCYYENRLEEAEELLDEARTRSKTLGDRMNEFQANEYLCMIEIERGDFEAAKSRCQNLLTIGEKLRQGSEAPFAQALNAVCDFAITQKDPGIDAALQLLRDVDAKQRLTYALNRVAMLDIRMENWDSGITRATEALEHAQVMDRASEIITARVVLAEAYQAQSQNQAYQEQLQALLDTPETVGAKWARDRAARLTENYNNQ